MGQTQRLRDRVAIVTGAGQGVGLGVARAFAAEGASIVVANRGAESGESAAAGIDRDFATQGGRARYVKTDVSQKDSVIAMVAATLEAFGRVDILVNNATPTEGGARLEAMTDEAMRDHMDVNYFGCFWAMQCVFPIMSANAWGRIITMGSLSGINAHKNAAMYNGSKEGVRALTRSAAVEWGRYGITANILCPFAATPAWEGFKKFDPAAARRLEGGNPIPHIGDCEADIGPVAVFLASDDSRFVTGNTIHVDGGGHINGVAWNPEHPE
jgi:NAD(P)-dependent dehydrogenase (short-subunit alcohol dehydrogenase family)